MLRLHGRYNIINVVLESRYRLVNGAVRALYVMMNVDEVERAVLAIGKEGFQIVQPGSPDPVRDCGSGDAGATAFERHHVLLEDFGGILRTQIGLAGIVWLVGSVRTSPGVSIHCNSSDKERETFGTTTYANTVLTAPLSISGPTVLSHLEF